MPTLIKDKINQSNLCRNNLLKYLKTRKTQNKLLINKFTDFSGACLGFATAWAVMSMEGFQTWWEAALKEISEWDGHTGTLKNQVTNLPGQKNPCTLENLMERVLNYLIPNQYFNKPDIWMMGVNPLIYKEFELSKSFGFNQRGVLRPNKDLTDGIPKLEYLDKNGKIKVVKHCEEIYLNENKSNKEIKKEYFIDVMDNDLKQLNDSVIIFGGDRHAVSARYDAKINKWIFYDSNNHQGSIQLEDTESLFYEMRKRVGYEFLIVVSTFVEKKPELNSYKKIRMTRDNETELHLACRARENKKIENILNNDTKDLNRNNNYKKRPIDIAIANNDKEIVSLLLKNGADILINNTKKISYFTKNEYFYGDIIEFSKNSGKDINTIKITCVNKENTKKFDLLTYAIKNGHKSSIETLLDNGILVTKEALKEAISIKDPNIIESIFKNVVENSPVLLQKKLNKDETPLSLALKIGNEKAVKLFLNYKKPNQFSSLQMAGNILENVKSRNFEDQNFLDPSAPVSKNKTPLMVACESTHLGEVGIKSLLESLKKNKVDLKTYLNTNFDDGSTPLTKACQSGSISVIKALLEYGANPNLADKNHQTPFMALLCTSLDNSFKTGLKLLENNGIKIDKNTINKCFSDHSTPLTKACEKGSVAAVEYLLKEGADPKLIDNKKKSPIQLACSSEDIGKLEKFRNFLPNLYLIIKDEHIPKDELPLTLAIKNGDKDLVEKLLQKGADPFKENKQKISYFMLAISNKDKDFFELFNRYTNKSKTLESGIINKDLSDKTTPLTRACKYGAPETIDLLVNEYNADQKKQDQCGDTPLTASFLNENKNTFFTKDLKIKEVNWPLPDNKTPLTLAASRKDYDTVDFLLDNGADPFRTDIQSNSLISIACMEGDWDLLIKVKNYCEKQDIKKSQEKDHYINKLKKYVSTTKLPNGKTALTQAASFPNKYRFFLKVSILVGRNGFQVQDNNGDTPFMAIFSNKQNQILRRMIDKDRIKLDDFVNKKLSEYKQNNKYSGMTPLTLALKNKNIKLASDLLKQGANPYLKDDCGGRKIYNNIPLIQACELKNKTLINEFKENMIIINKAKPDFIHNALKDEDSVSVLIKYLPLLKESLGENDKIFILIQLAALKQKINKEIEPVFFSSSQHTNFFLKLNKMLEKAIEEFLTDKNFSMRDLVNEYLSEEDIPSLKNIKILSNSMKNFIPEPLRQALEEKNNEIPTKNSLGGLNVLNYSTLND